MNAPSDRGIERNRSRCAAQVKRNREFNRPSSLLEQSHGAQTAGERLCDHEISPTAQVPIASANAQTFKAIIVAVVTEDVLRGVDVRNALRCEKLQQCIIESNASLDHP